MELLFTALSAIGDFLVNVAVVASLACTFLVVGGFACVFIVGACEFLWSGE